MREIADAERIRAFMRELGRHATSRVRVYFTGGTCAVLMGWRPSTADVDLRFIPDVDAIYRALPALKEQLHINVELAAPSDFIPELPGWADRSAYIASEGNVDYYHYDFYSQALSKIERNHAQDVLDVAMMLKTGLIERDALLRHFDAIEQSLYKYPALDAADFRRAVERVVTER